MNKKIKGIIYLLILTIPAMTIYIITQRTITQYRESLKEYNQSLSKYAKNIKEKNLEIYVEPTA